MVGIPTRVIAGTGSGLSLIVAGGEILTTDTVADGTLLALPAGTTAQRPAFPGIRYNTDTAKIEWSMDGSNWSTARDPLTQPQPAAVIGVSGFNDQIPPQGGSPAVLLNIVTRQPFDASHFTFVTTPVTAVRIDTTGWYMATVNFEAWPVGTASVHGGLEIVLYDPTTSTEYASAYAWTTNLAANDHCEATGFTTFVQVPTPGSVHLTLGMRTLHQPRTFRTGEYYVNLSIHRVRDQ